MAVVGGTELGTNTKHGLHTEDLTALQNMIKLAGHLNNQYGLQAHLQTLQGKVDKLLILVAVTNDVGLGVMHVGEGCKKLRLAARLEPKVILLTEVGDFLDDLLLLVHFHRIHPPIRAQVITLGDRLVECLIEFGDSLRKEIMETQKEWWIESTLTYA